MGVEPTGDTECPPTELKLRAPLGTTHASRSTQSIALVNSFLKSRREGTSPRTREFYSGYLARSSNVVGFNITGPDITDFLKSLKCSGGGKAAYFCTLRSFYNWLYSPASGYKLDHQNNPVMWVEPPKADNKILPSLTVEQVAFLLEQARSVRDRAIISLFADSGLRLSELANIKLPDIDWEHRVIKVVCKGNRQGLALFGGRTETLLKEWLDGRTSGRLWNLNWWGVHDMLKRLSVKTGLPCNPHTFRRTFASILAKRGVDVLHIMRLGRWSSISMVQHYTKTVQFEDSAKFYSAIVN
jgi:site-specific recombinase XerD